MRPNNRVGRVSLKYKKLLGSSEEFQPDIFFGTFADEGSSSSDALHVAAIDASPVEIAATPAGLTTAATAFVTEAVAIYEGSISTPAPAQFGAAIAVQDLSTLGEPQSHSQWHILNTNENNGGVDTNVTPAWAM